jgi:hypothetical protein
LDIFCVLKSLLYDKERGEKESGEEMEGRVKERRGNK